MVRYRTHLLACGALLATLIAALPVVQALGRSNPRDFPEGTYCPFNLGYQVVGDNNDTSIPPTITPPTRPARLSFTAEKAKAVVTFIACDRGLTGDHPEGLDIAIRNFAVVREDVYNSHQRINTDINMPFSCNISQDINTPWANTVGSVFDPSVAPAVAINSKFVPFFDDFGDLTASNLNWKLDGAEIVTLNNINDPIDPFPASENALILVRGKEDTTRDTCTAASVKVSRLKAGTRYVVDFRWNVSGIISNLDRQPPEVDMLTYVDTNPKE